MKLPSTNLHLRQPSCRLFYLVLLASCYLIQPLLGQTSDPFGIDIDDIDTAIDEWQCDYIQDNCRLDFQLDSQCDALYTCPDADCFDCDPCRAFDMNCTGCVNAGSSPSGDGCHWCPGDAKCRSEPLGQDFWNLHPDRIPSCPSVEDWQQTCEPLSEDNVFSDPLYDSMKWSYDLINVEPVWRQGITGAGVHVRINDVGLDAAHPEFAGHFDWANSCPSFKSDSLGRHGTAVASVIGASADNSHCAAGIAPDVTLSACTFLETSIETELVDLMTSQLEEVDISNNSWGPSTCFNLNYIRRLKTRFLQGKQPGKQQPNENKQQCVFDESHPASPCSLCGDLMSSNDPRGVDTEGILVICERAINNYCTGFFDNDQIACAEFLDIYVSCEYHALSDEAYYAFAQGVVDGRQGRGIVYVFAGGNSHDVGAFTNSDGFVNTRFTIAVGAVDKFGRHASYSTVGSALHVVAPGGDLEFISNNILAAPGGGCTQIAGGSSFSAPVVSGVVALMLQVTPTLGWRDVQAILASTSQQVDPTDPSWTTNAAGLHHSYKYGFGIVDALAAVEASRSWTNYGPEKQLIIQSGAIALTIADDALVNNTSVLTVSEEAAVNFTVESVVLYLDLAHASRGDLEIVLTSPSGTESLLHPQKRPENQQLAQNETWKLMTVRNWGETANGPWTLKIRDGRLGQRGSCANMLFEHLWIHPVYKTTEVYSCLAAAKQYHCINGEVRSQAVYQFPDRSRENLTADVACCDCGGGVEVSEVNVLRSWTLAIYGHNSLQEVHPLNGNNSNGFLGSTASTVPISSPGIDAGDVTGADTDNTTGILLDTSANGNDFESTPVEKEGAPSALTSESQKETPQNLLASDPSSSSPLFVVGLYWAMGFFGVAAIMLF